MLKQSLQQKLLQKLSPQQIQMIKLLEIPTLELEQRIKKEIEENPALEEDEDHPVDIESITGDNDENETDSDEFSLNDYLNDEDIPSYKTYVNNRSRDDETREVPFAGAATYQELLKQQLGLRPLTEKQLILGEFIIGNIDEDGYLRRSLRSVSDDLAFMHNITATEDELEEVLEIIQQFDPAGTGARTLQECLQLQIDRLENHNQTISTARQIIQHYFPEFTRKHYDKISQKLNLSPRQLKEAIDEILRLNPKPGGTFADPHERSMQTIIPDFILESENDELNLTLNNSNIPELKISQTYAGMIESYQVNKQKANRQQKEAIAFVRQKIDSARWFIDAIRQRQNTLLLTMNAIVQYQREFFLTGDEKKLKPMILKDIADRTGLDISTISRVANSKYIQTAFGIYLLKYFFSEAMQTSEGEEVSSREVKAILTECVDNEDKSNPLTDEELTAILQQKGYKIARRTVAKYREQLNIPVGRLRKEL